MTRLALAHNAVNLSQGFPDFPAPAEIKEAAQRAIAADTNQYAITWGAKSLRNAIAQKVERQQGMSIDPEREITVCCGATEAMISTMMALINPGDEVIAFEPFYENYGPDAILSGATPRFVKLRPPDWRFDPDELKAAFGPATKAIILNTPNNPTGKVFARAEIEQIRDLCDPLECLHHHRRDFRAHGVRRRPAHFASDPSRPSRTNHHDKRPIQDLQRDRLARRLGDCSAGSDFGDPQSARFSHGRRRRSISRSRSRRFAIPGNLLPEIGRRFSRSPQ